MHAVAMGSVTLAVLVGVLNVLTIKGDLHFSDAKAAEMIFLVPILINIGAVFWVLKQTAPQSGYRKQLLNGLLVGW